MSDNDTDGMERKVCSSKQCIPHFECGCEPPFSLEFRGSDLYCVDCDSIRVESVCKAHRSLYPDTEQ